MTIELETEVSAGRRIFTAVRVQTAAYLSAFIRTPLAWVLIGGIIAFTAWQTQLREGNRMACAATATTVDTQIFREVVAGGGDGTGTTPALFRACAGLSLPGPNWRRD